MFSVSLLALNHQEFCVAMHLVQCCKRGLPLPHKRKRDLAPETPKNRTSDSSRRSSRSSRSNNIRKTDPVVKSRSKETKLPRSPKRRSRMASLLGEDQQLELSKESRGFAVRNSEQDTREEQQVSRRNTREWVCIMLKWIIKLCRVLYRARWPPKFTRGCKAAFTTHTRAGCRKVRGKNREDRHGSKWLHQRETCSRSTA